MSRLITSVQALPLCEVKVYYSHESYDDNDVCSDSVVDVHNEGCTLGIVESYIGNEPLEHFISLITDYDAVEQPVWYDLESIDYAIIETTDNNIHFYYSGSCQVYLCVKNVWHDLYDLMSDVEIFQENSFVNPVLGFSKYMDIRDVTEILISSDDFGLKVEDLNDRLLEDYDFMSHVDLDETNDMHIMHVKFNK